MHSTSASLWAATSALAVATVTLTALGLRQRRPRGWGAWIAALWLACAGGAVAALAHGPGAAMVAQVLLLQWPLLTVAGVRRFHARTPLPGSPRMDLAVFLLAGGLGASGPLWGADSTPGTLLAAGGAVALHFYAAGVLLGGPGGRDALPLQLLGLTLVLAGLGPLPALDADLAPALALGPRALATTLGGLVTAFVALTLVFERTERQLRDSHRRLKVLANIDALTRVPNRRHFHELATQALRADEPGTATLLMLDIDHFKHINDHLGHGAGDRALRLVSGTMQEHLRAQDVAGRHGGDEFVLLLRETAVRDGLGVAARIVDRLQRQAAATALPPLTLSFGAVQVLPAETIDDALRRADQALYEAKRQGRSCAVSAEGDADEPVFSESRRLGLLPL